MSASVRILVVEDESLVALYVEDVLTELGYTVARVVGRVDHAFQVPPESYDIAVLEVHLAGKDIFPFADELIARNTPFVFTTGYGEMGLPEQYRHFPNLQKPFNDEALKEAVASLSATIVQN